MFVRVRCPIVGRAVRRRESGSRGVWESVNSCDSSRERVREQAMERFHTVILIFEPQRRLARFGRIGSAESWRSRRRRPQRLVQIQLLGGLRRSTGGEDGDRADGAAARSRVKFGPDSGRPKGALFLRRWQDPRLAGWRNDVLHPQVGDQVAVVFPTVHAVAHQHA
jgi:hypothetical protein